MKSLQELLDYIKKKDELEKETNLKSYKRFIKLIKDMFKLILSNPYEELAIISYFDTYEIHFNEHTLITNSIELSKNSDGRLTITKFIMYDNYNKKSIELELSTAKNIDIEIFFAGDDFDFERKVVWQRDRDGLYNNIENSINSTIFEHHKEQFTNADFDYEKFIGSEFSFKITKDIRNECEKLIDEYKSGSIDINKEEDDVIDEIETESPEDN